MSKLFKALLIAMLFSVGNLWAGVPVVTDLSDHTFLEQDPAIIYDNSVTFTGGDDYSDGYLTIDIANPHVGDMLSLITVATPSTVAGEVSTIVNANGGFQVYLGNGTTADRIGQIDGTENGENGNVLKITFLKALKNGSFESGLDDWTQFNSLYSTTNNLNGFRIPINPSDQSGGVTTGTVHISTENLSSATINVVSGTDEYSDGTQGLRLVSDGTVPSTSPANGDGANSMHGPYIRSSVFSAANGDTFSVDWKAQNGGDWYEVFGFLIGAGPDKIFDTADDVRTTMFSERGSTRAWMTSSVSITTGDGDYRFEFVCGSYDATGGTVLGASLYVDNIQLISSSIPVIDDSVLEKLVKLITYQNISDYPPIGTRLITYTAMSKSGDIGSQNANLTIANGGINDAPINNIPGNQIATEDVNLVFSAANGNAITVSDPDVANNLKVTITVTNGDFTLSQTTGLSFDDGDGLNDTTMTFVGSVPNINAALENSYFLGAPDYNGPANLEIFSDDQGFTGSGGVLTDTDDFDITINAVDDPPSITANATPNYEEEDSPVILDASLTVTDPDGDIHGASVTIENLKAGDVLSYDANLLPVGVNPAWNSSTGILMFSGDASPTEYEDLLRSVTFENTIDDEPDFSDRTITFSLGSALSFSGNGHLYEYVPASLTWAEARDAAALKTYNGLQGYLFNVTSAEENAFLLAKMTTDGWLGASDESSEGDWRWMTGPEAGTQFWQGTSSGSVVNGEYENWRSGEPNNLGDEDYAQFYSDGAWNDLNGTQGLSYIVEYGGMPGDPILNTTATITLTVADLNDAPIITSNPILSVLEDQPYTYTLIATDVDASNDILTPSVVGSLPSWLSFDTNTGVLSGTPDYTNVGLHNITLRVSDGNGGVTDQAFTIEVINVNDAPVIVSQVANIDFDEDSSREIVFTDINVTDSDPDDTYPIGFTLTVLPGNNYTVVNNVVSPNPDWNGTLTVPVKVNDGDADSNIFNLTISINPVNESPTVANPISDFTVLEDADNTVLDLSNVFDDIDSDNDSIIKTVFSNSNSSLVTTTMNGDDLILDYQLNQYGQATIVILATSAGLTVKETFVVTVTPVDDAPTVVNHINNIIVQEDAINTVISIANTFDDVDNDNALITKTVRSGNPSLVTAVVNGNTLTLDYQLNQNGMTTVTVTGTSNGLTVNEVFNVTVNSVNDAPVINSQNEISFNEDTTRTVLFSDLNVTDVDDNYSNGFILSVQTGANYTLSGNTIIPAPNYNGTLTVPVMVNDGDLNSNIFNLVVTIISVDDAPTVANAISDVTVDEDADDTIINLLNTFDDVDNENTAIVKTVVSGKPSLVTAVINGNTLTLDYQAEMNGNTIITVTGTSNNLTVEESFNVTVRPINDEPYITSTAITTVNQFDEYSYSVVAEDDDIPADTLVYSALNSTPLPSWLSIDENTGLLSGTPTEIGEFFVCLVVKDGNGGEAQQCFTITVNNVDECALETDDCDTNATCKDTEGAYTCTCKSGYHNPVGTEEEALGRVCNEECGDGVRTPAESCDDGNLDNLDGCTDTCIPETGWTCSNTVPNICTEDDTDNDGVVDNDDNCPLVANGDNEDSQLDTDLDGLGNACDADDDNDGINDLDENGDILDNCSVVYNPEQTNTDLDAFGDLCDDDLDGDTVANDTDNCVYIPNTNQDNQDNDEFGDACDSDSGNNDVDNDGILNDVDNCVNIPNVDQIDTDNDGLGDVCDEDLDGDTINDDVDNCKFIANGPNDAENQVDTDNDGLGDVCDSDNPADLDTDGDTIPDLTDNCQQVPNTDQANNDNDAFGDVCDADDDNDNVNDSEDNCLLIPNTDQLDTDNDGMGNVCDADDDNDGVLDDDDNCDLTPNADNQSDIDNDGVGDVCDDSDNDGWFDVDDNCNDAYNPNQLDIDLDGIGDACDEDIDGDTVNNDDDNCVYTSNLNQSDINDNGIGDICDSVRDTDNDGVDDFDVDGNLLDNCVSMPNPEQIDTDNDGLGDECDEDIDNDGVNNNIDNCIFIANPLQEDSNSNRIGDACDSDAGGDRDGDTILDDEDNCPLVPNTDQLDTDGDSFGNVCDSDDDNDGVLDNDDNCKIVANENQEDSDNDGLGDICDGDIDGDTVLDIEDNCPLIANTNQLNTDGDEFGDVCDTDDDDDGIDDSTDNCPLVANADQLDTDRDDIGDICDNDKDGDNINDDTDNCPLIANPNQENNDDDELGNVCDEDDDNDTINDDTDNCPLIANPNQENNDDDELGNACDEDDDNDTINDDKDNCPLVVNTDQADIDKDGLGDVCDAKDDTPVVVNNELSGSSIVGCDYASGNNGSYLMFLLLGAFLFIFRKKRVGK